MEEQTTKSGMSVGVVVAVAAVVAIAFGGGTYAYVNGKANKEKDELKTQIAQLENGTASASATAASSPSSAKSATATTSATDETANWKTYTNTKYGFTLTFTDKWQGYRIKNFASSPMTEVISVEVPTTDANYQSRSTEYVDAGYDYPFVISVWTTDQWNQWVEGQDGPQSKKLGEKNGYVFAYMTWQDSPADLRASGLDKEVTSVAESFQFTK